MVGLGVDEEQQDGALRLEPSSAALQGEEQGPHLQRGREREEREPGKGSMFHQLPRRARR